MLMPVKCICLNSKVTAYSERCPSSAGKKGFCEAAEQTLTVSRKLTYSKNAFIYVDIRPDVFQLDPGAVLVVIGYFHFDDDLFSGIEIKPDTGEKLRQLPPDRGELGYPEIL